MYLSKAASIFLKNAIHTHSKRGYKACFNSIHRFEVILGDRPISDILNKDLIKLFYQKLQEKHAISSSTLYQTVLYLKKFYLFLGDKNIIEKFNEIELDDLLDYRRIWHEYYNHFQNDLNPDCIDPEEEDTLMYYWTHQEPTLISLRNAAILSVLIDSGMKIGNVVLLREKDYSFQDSSITYYFKDQTITAKLSRHANRLLQNYIDLRPGFDGCIFVSHTKNDRHTKLSIRTVERILNQTTSDPLFNRKITSMQIRYAYIARKIAEGKSDKKISTDLGYSGKTLQRFAIATGVRNKPEKNVFKYIGDLKRIEELANKWSLDKQKLREVLNDASLEIRRIKREDFARENEVDKFIQEVRKSCVEKTILSS